VTARFDLDEIHRSLRLLVEDGGVALLRLRVASGSRVEHLAGYYDDLGALARDAARWSGRTDCVRVSADPVDPARLAWARNRLRLETEERTHDADCPRRRWLFVDLDPRGEPGTSSTDAEHAATLASAAALRAWLGSLGWPAPVLADSGNGSHLLYRLDLPSSPAVTRMIERALAALELRFGTAETVVDVWAGTASRTGKLYGTLAAKGPSTPGRPHRLARLLDVPPRLEVVPPARLVELLRTPAPGPPR
jgi:hypothetical protein